MERREEKEKERKEEERREKAKGKQSNRAVARKKKIGGNKTVVEKKSTQKSSTGLKITGTRKRLNGKQWRRNSGEGVKKHDYCGYTKLEQGFSNSLV